MCDPGIYTDVCFFSGPAPIDGSERQKDSVWTGGVRRKIRCLAILDRQLRQSRLVLEDAGMVAHTYAVHTMKYFIVHLPYRNQEWVVAGLRVHIWTASSTKDDSWSTGVQTRCKDRCKITRQLQSCNELYLFLGQLQAYMLHTITRTPSIGPMVPAVSWYRRSRLFQENLFLCFV